MSAQHTQGRLIVRGGYSIYAADGKTPVADACLINSVAVHDEANARRLVACWNACDGVPTADLEQYASLDGCDNETVARLKFIIGLTRQRDELLAALEKAERKLSAYVGVCTGDKELTDAVLPMARAAIAKVKGGAA